MENARKLRERGERTRVEHAMRLLERAHALAPSRRLELAQVTTIASSYTAPAAQVGSLSAPPPVVSGVGVVGLVALVALVALVLLCAASCTSPPLEALSVLDCLSCAACPIVLY
jgi:hypothetical protein